jgi:hypothetical protein
MRKLLLFIVTILSGFICYSQEDKGTSVQNALRITFISLGFEYEFALTNKATIAANAGLTIPGSYPNQDIEGNGFFYYVAPFFDLSYKRFYNRERRLANNKNIAFNSGNYWSARLLTNFKEIYAHNISRTDNISFALGPTWGSQRAYGKVHFLFDVGPVYYFDTKGNNGFFPFMIQLNLGYNLKDYK